MTRFVASLPLFLLLLFAGCEPASVPQEVIPRVGTLEGTVTLGTAGGNRGILVALTGMSRVAVTDDAGAYQITEVPWGGPYTLIASKTGYQEVSVEVAVPPRQGVTVVGPLVLGALPVVDPQLRLVTLGGTDRTSLWGREALDLGIREPRKVTVKAELPAGGALVTYLLTNTARYADRSLAEFDPFAPVRSSRFSPKRRELAGLTASGMAAWIKQKTSPRSRALSPVSPPGVVGQKLTFTDALWYTTPATVNKHAVTLKKVVTAKGRNLHVWVEDAAWAKASGAPTTPKTGLTHGVTQAMVDDLAAKFLTDGVNDLYGWETGLYGVEWPDTGAPPGQDGVLIDGGGNLHIFLINLNPGGTANGTLMGYFHSLNAIVGATGSNSKVLFALDADSLATDPSEIVSTLAHEFQHMIHYYQKQVLHDLSRGTDAWIDEMASLVTEDLMADKLGVAGPRGVASSEPGPGPWANQAGRIPLFNYWHEGIPLQTWLPDAEVLKSYSNAYAFGAWLVRNYGGPGLFRSLVHDAQTDYHAVVTAVRQTPEGADQTYESLVCDWGLATFLRDSTTPPFRYRSSVDVFQWEDEGRSYSAGSLDLGRFRYSDGGPETFDGPYVFDGPTEAASQVSAGATYFQSVGSHSGTFFRELWMPADVVLTVVAVPNQP